MRDVLDGIEARFSCNFAYSDNDLASHYLVEPTTRSLEEALEILRNRTLFEYELLPDLTVTVAPKTGLINSCGQILGGNPGEPLQDVLVLTPYQQLRSDQDGVFELRTMAPDDPIVLRYTGYSTLRTRSGAYASTPCRTIVLEPKVEQLSQVFLTNFLTRGINKNKDGSLEIRYSDFDILPGLIETDVLQTIQALPGIQSVNETVSDINIRGGTNDQNLILLDGVKMYQTGHFFGLISAFNPYLTKDAKVIKNGTPSRLGDGVSGTIIMKGEEQVNDSLTAGIGTNLISADAYVDLPLGNKASLQVAGRTSINGLLETPTYNAYFDRVFQNTEVISNSESESVSDDDFQFYDAYMRLLVEPSDKDYIRANVLVLGNALTFIENAEVAGITESRGSSLNQDNLSGGVFYRREWNERFQSSFQWYGSRYQLEARNVDVINNQELIQKNKVEETGFRISTSYRWNNGIRLESGYQFNETGITNFERINNPVFERTDKQVLRTNSLFADLNYNSPNGRTTLVAGLRMNHINKFNTVLLEPRLRFNQRISDHLSVELLGELKSQTTSQVVDFQNDFLGVENRRWVLSAPDVLPVIKGRQASLGVTYSRQGWLLTLEPYIKHIDGISSQSQGFQNQFEDARVIGEYMVKGIDFLIDKRFDVLNTWLSYSYADNDYTFEELQPSVFHNNLDVRHTVTAGSSYSWNDFKLAAGLNWHSGKPTTLPVPGEEIIDGQINFQLPNSSNIADYFRVDVSATYRFGIGERIRAFAGASIWNLLGKDNIINTFFRINSAGELEQVNERALEFTPNFSFRLEF